MSISYQDLPLTNFPDNVDTFVQMLDIVASDASALKEYQSAMENGNITQANLALAKIPNAQRKLLTADKINKVYEAIEALERFWASDIHPYTENLQEDWLSVINQFNYVGAYSSTQSYKKNNIVSYKNGAYTYLFLCKGDNVKGKLPTNTTYWLQLTIMGTRGESGSNFSFAYDWDNTTTYSRQDCVTYNGKLWGCTEQNVGSEPTSGSTKWMELVSLSGKIYPIQATEPIEQSVNDVWYQTIGSAF